MIAETCDACEHSLTDPAYSVDGLGFLCSGCTRAALVHDYQNRPRHDLDAPPLIVVGIVPCPTCGMFGDCEHDS
jgi:hypothetical protein